MLEVSKVHVMQEVELLHNNNNTPTTHPQLPLRSVPVLISLSPLDICGLTQHFRAFYLV